MEKYKTATYSIKRKKDEKKGWGQKLSVARVAPGSAPELPFMNMVLVILTFQKPNALYRHYMLLMRMAG